jgi:DNA-binding winged helix-turn-helix (wHTH) protein
VRRLGFYDFEIDPVLCTLWREGQSVRLSSLPFRLLLHLARNATRVVSREELLCVVWEGVHVGENALEQAVRAVRTALAPDGGLLEAVRGRGYRLAAAVEIAPPDPPYEPLVGRGDVLARLDDALARARAGRGGAVLLVGGPGLGKSRLLRELLDRSETLGFATRSVRCGTGPASEVLAELRRGLAGNPETARWAGPELPSGTGHPPVPYRIERDLLTAARRRPLLIAIDDLHRAEAGGWEPLEEIAARAGDGPLVVVAGARSGAEPPARLLLRAPETRIEVLRALGLGEVRQLATALLREPVPTQRAARLLQHSGGNPCSLLAILRHSLVCLRRADRESLVADL